MAGKRNGDGGGSRSRRSSSKQQQLVTSQNDNDDDHHHDDDATHSIFSFIQSIIDRRRDMIPGVTPVVQARVVKEEEEGLRRASKSRSNNRTNKRNRRNTSSSPSSSSRPIHPLVLLVIVGLASNWVATRILNSLSTDVEVVDVVVHGVQSKGVPSSIHNERYSEQYEPLKLHEDHEEEINTPTINVTEVESFRFVNLRKRLLSLYAQHVPETTILASNATKKNNNLHPLYNAHSPQYRALDWLANIDKLSLRYNDPGLIQRYVVTVLYYSTSGPYIDANTDLSQKYKGPWRNPTNFLAPTHECEWKSRIIDNQGRGGGVRRCDENNTINELVLYNELAGTIPTEIGRLWNLQILYLGRNKLTGTIPTELGQLTKLTSLSLQHNDLSGQIPQSHLKSLQTLTALQLEGNEKLHGKIERHSLLCQMRNKYRGTPPKDQEKYTGRRVLRIFTATCVPTTKGNKVVSDRLECSCCTECFGKTQKDLIYD